MGKLIGFQRAELPVYVCCEAVDSVSALSLSLRSYGLRTRVFTSMAVMETAARSHLPLALLLCAETIREAARRQLRQRLEAAWGCRVPVAVLGRDGGLQARLEAVEAGASAFFAPPHGRRAVVGFLHGLLKTEAEGAAAVALVAEPGSDLAQAAASMEGEDLQVRLEPPDQELPRRLMSTPPDLLIVDGDLAEPSPLLLARALGQVPGMVTVPIMLGTSADKRSLDEAARDGSIDRLFGLPVEPADLQAMALTLVRRARQQQWAHRLMARRDPTTGLLSREHFLDTLLQVPLSPDSGTHYALLCLAVDGPDDVAESATQHVAAELQRVLPPSAPGARLEPHLFAALLEGPDPETLAGLCARLEQRLTAAGDQRSAGLRLHATRLARRHRNLLEALDEACGNLEHRPASAGGTWASRVREALRDNRFRLVFQPVSCLNGQFEELFETFLRMLDDQGEDIPPYDFLSAAREAGLAHEVDRWVLEHAVRVLAQQATGAAPTLFVKLFPETVADPELLPWLGRLLGREGVAPHRLVLEIPHGCVVHQRSTTQALVEGLRALGCGRTVEYFDDLEDPELRALDLPLDFLKLAPELTRTLADDAALRQRVESVTRHCRERGVAPIASRVQDASALALLWRSGVEYIQGNFMQEPADVFATSPPEAIGN